MITDGNKNVQKNKISALGVKKYFIKISYATGKNMKPSPKSYAAILKLLKLKPEQVTYIGDNPSVDFVTPNKMEMPTIRVLTGYFKNLQLDSQHEAIYTINSLTKIFDVLDLLQRKRLSIMDKNFL